MRARGEDVRPETFATRGIFGQYLRELLDTSEREAAGSRLTRLRGDVVALAEPEGAARPLRVELADGTEIEADRVVLALGHLPGGDPVPVPRQLRESGVYVPDPWAPGALDAARGDGSVLIVGTGLTTVDVSLSLAGGEGGPAVLAVSRNGLIPRRHREDLTTVEEFAVPVGGEELDPVIAAVRERIDQVTERGGDWRDVFDSMRTPTPAIWRGLRVEEKRRFLATMMRFWDVHRFRMAPLVADRFAALRQSGRVTVEAAAIAAIEPAGAGAAVSLVGADGASRTVEVDRVINCTGAGVDLLAHGAAAGRRPDRVRDRQARRPRPRPRRRPQRRPDRRRGPAVAADRRDRRPAQGGRVGGDRRDRDPRPRRRRGPARLRRRRRGARDGALSRRPAQPPRAALTSF